MGNTPEVLSETTADMAFALLMAAARRIVEGVAYVKAGQWQTWGPKLLLGQDVHGATLGIVGMGRIGQAVAQRASGFEMKVLYYDTVRQQEAEARLGVEYRPLEEVLRESDYVSLHVNLIRLGRTYCRPARPLCAACPIRRRCDQGRGSSGRRAAERGDA